MSSSPHKKAVIIISLLTLAAFGNALFNGFVGDDYFLFLNNIFYRSWTNVLQIFSQHYISIPDQIFNARDSIQNLNSGAVSYRPVLSLTYFLDYHLWKLNPFGYHLQNLLWHFGNSLLVYFLVLFLLKRNGLALLGAVLFCVHPLQSESVCAIGYRADMIACFFILGAFLCYERWSRAEDGRHPATLFFFSHFLFFIALMAKESAIVFPLLLMAFDRFIRGGKFVDIFRALKSRYLGFILIVVFYLYLYIKVFPNGTLSNAGFIGGSFLTHDLAVLRILGNYLTAFVFPFTVKILPPVFSPPVDYQTGLGMILVLVFGCALAKAWRSSGIVTFFLLWFLIAFIPVSNIVPIINPMAYRFMYFPLIGLAAATALFINKIAARFDRAEIQWGKMLTIILVGLCLVRSVGLNSAWKNNFVMASYMVRDNPEVPTGYLYLGGEYFDRGLFNKAQVTLEKGIALGLEDPRAYCMLGFTINDFEQSRFYYQKSVALFPYYAASYTALGRLYLFKRDDLEKALPYLQKSLELTPSYTAYGYLIQVYLLTDRPDQAQAVLRKAQQTILDQQSLQSLANFFLPEEQGRLPVDIGV